jgi:hypothetical protein
MAIQFNPGRSAPEPDADLMSDPFMVLLESQGRELLGRRYDYVADLLEEGFEDTYALLFSSSRLHYEVINIVGLCTPTMNTFQFPRRPGNAVLKKAITALIRKYLTDHIYGRNP